MFAIPSVTIFVRHSAKCSRRGDEFHRSCKCPKHFRWSHAGKQHRRSAKTRTWTIAEEKRRKLESQFEAAQNGGLSPASISVSSTQESRPTITRAIKLFLMDKDSQGVGPYTMKRYRREFQRLDDFMANRFVFFPHEITQESVTEYRAGWIEHYQSSATRSDVQSRLRGFFRYLVDTRLIDRSPVLAPIRVDEPPTLPLTEAQYENLLGTIPLQFEFANKATRVRALVQLMRHSGLAVGDAVALKREELVEDSRKSLYRITTSRQKTGTHVSVPIPSDVAKELLAAMKLNPNATYIFWNPRLGGTRETVVSNWQKDLRKVFRAAGMPEGHPHQLRDTFAVGLLEKGVPLEEVSKLLGHTSIKTTEKHYAPWVRSRQERLDSLVLATWVKA